jgi:hypothetical protein
MTGSTGHPAGQTATPARLRSMMTTLLAVSRMTRTHVTQVTQ